MNLPSRTNVNDLFGQKIRLTVPSYQRAYSWQVGAGVNDQVGQFLRDLQDQNPSIWYSLGHFLLSATDAENVFEVIDGQQRLTTVVIFMSCLVSECQRRGIEALDGTDVAEIKETYLIHRVQKFKTVDDDAAYFLNRIIQGNQSASRLTNRRSEKNIDEAAQFFSGKMKDASLDELTAWYSVLGRAKLTTYVVAGEDAKQISAQMFSYQNDRGKDLTVLEKVKAYLIAEI